MRRDFIPAPGDLLCESCGYVLNGLPDDGQCPECGKPVADSTVASPRRPSAWEAGRDRAVGRFQFTALSVLRAPRRFFRTLTAHGDTARSGRFGFIAVLPAWFFNTKTVLMHCVIMTITFNFFTRAQLVLLLPVVPILVAAAWAAMYLAVVRLTTIESRFWGMRLPKDVVRRALHYDAVHVSAASLLPWAVSLFYLCLVISNDVAAQRYASTYLYTLSGAVVAVAVYLFSIYAASMRSLMYANR